jgi:ribosomal protein S8
MNLKKTKVVQEQEKKLAEVVEFVYSSECRRGYFSKYFDDRSSSPSIVAHFTSDKGPKESINCESCGTCAKRFRQNTPLSIDSLIGVKNEKLKINLSTQIVRWMREFDPLSKKTVFEFEKVDKKSKASLKTVIISTDKGILELKEKRSKSNRGFNWRRRFKKSK